MTKTLPTSVPPNQRVSRRIRPELRAAERRPARLGGIAIRTIAAFALLLSSAVPVGAAARVSSDVVRVLVATETGLRTLEGDRSAARDLASLRDGVTGLAADPARGQLWVRTAERLVLLDEEGEMVSEVRLGAGAGAPRMEVLPADGSVWLAEGARLLSLSGGGVRFHELELEAPILDLALDRGRSRLWVVTGAGVRALDPVSGAALEGIGLDDLGGAPPVQLEIDPLTGEAWVATAADLRRVGADGEVVTVSGVAGLETLRLVRSEAADAALWAARGNEVLRLDSVGEAVRSYLPFDAGSSVRGLAADPVSGSAWATDGRSVVELTSDGAVLVRAALDAEDGATALLALGLPGLGGVDDGGEEEPASLPPAIVFVSPAPGARLAVPYPTIELAITQGSATAMLETLVLTANGQVVAVECEATEAGMSCAVEDRLPSGNVRLAASIRDGDDRRSEEAFVDVSVQNPAPPPASDDPSPVPTGPHTYTPIVSPRGYQTNNVYAIPSGLESISTTSGNLTLRIPLGQTYSVGPKISYQLAAVYNSRVWEHHEAVCSIQPQDGECSTADRPGVFALSNPQSNAGLGWEVHLGYLYQPTPPDDIPLHDRFRWPNHDSSPRYALSRWLYVSPDGASHFFYPLSGRDNGDGPNRAVRYTKDGSFMRMRQVDDDTVVIDRPDGVKITFRRTDQFNGTNFCGNGVGGCWRYAETRDGYGNRMWVEYPAYDAANQEETWVIKDSTKVTATQNRTHKIVFSRNPADTAGRDCPAGASPYCVPGTNDEWGDLRRVVKRVEVAAFGAAGATAVYTFQYEMPGRISRGCPHDDTLPGPTFGFTTPFLRSIDPPAGHGRGYRFTTNSTIHHGTNICDQVAGMVAELELPTRGKIAYHYGGWTSPTKCSYVNDPDLHNQRTLLGVDRRTVYKPSGLTYVEDGVTTYRNNLFPGVNSDFSGPNCLRDDYRRTIVDGPVDRNNRYTRTLHYSAVHQGPREPDADTPISEWQITDNGLPYTKTISDGTDDNDMLFLSKRVLQCSGSTCVKKRSTYVRYATEWGGGPQGQGCRKGNGRLDTADCWQINPVKVAEKTVYHDDKIGGEPRWMSHGSMDYDGVGNFRITRQEDNFDSVDRHPTRRKQVEKVLFTTFDPEGDYVTLPISPVTGLITPDAPGGYPPSQYLPSPDATGAPWIFTNYGRVETSLSFALDPGSDRTYETRYHFDGNGSLRCVRKFGAAPRSDDSQVAFLLGGTVGTNAGLPVKEIVSGGVNGRLDADGACRDNGLGGPEDGSRYVIDHSYHAYTLTQSSIADYPNLYRADIDPNTGLPKKTYNVSDQATVHSFDKLGRWLGDTPEGSLGAATVEVSYNNPDNGDAKMFVVHKDTATNPDTVLTSERSDYDHLGRLVKEFRWRPLGDSPVLSKREHVYDKAGLLRSSSTWQNDDGAFDDEIAVFYNLYDPFGRPWRVITPDGSKERIQYHGTRRKLSTKTVATPDGLRNVRVTTVYDSDGARTAVFNPLYDEITKYDPNGNVVERIRKKGSSGATQTRTYGWDNRGWLLGETLPETGALTYHRDAFGNVRRRIGSGRDLTWSYDPAGRRRKVQETVGLRRVWAEWEWADSNVLTGCASNPAACDYRKGKLIRSQRYHWLGTDAWPTVIKEYKYNAAMAKPGEVGLQVDWPTHDEDPIFVSKYSYDKLGNLKSFDYPPCPTGSACADDEHDLVAPPHRVEWSYIAGYPTLLTSSRGPAVGYAYHPNSQISLALYGNGVIGTYDIGTNGIPRTARRHFAKPAPPPLPAQHVLTIGPYSYDGAGNIYAIGTQEAYSYDEAGRIVYGRVTTEVSTDTEEYRYDIFDNITEVREDGSGWDEYPTSGATNRYLGQDGDVYYDNSGNVTEVGWIDDPGVPAFQVQWDAMDMQFSFVSNLTPRAETYYVYDADNLRVATLDAEADAIIYHLRDPLGRVIREYNVTGAGDAADWGDWVHVKDLIYGPEGIVARVHPLGTAYEMFHTDHLGTPRAITNQSGVRIGLHNYLPYGTEVDRDGQEDEISAKFTGHERDLHGFSDYMKGRTYIHPFRRFATPDPARDGWNLYGYVSGKPIGRNDPTGLLQNDTESGDGNSKCEDSRLFNETPVCPEEQPEPTPGLEGFAGFVGSIGGLALGVDTYLLARGPLKEAGELAMAGRFAGKIDRLRALFGGRGATLVNAFTRGAILSGGLSMAPTVAVGVEQVIDTKRSFDAAMTQALIQSMGTGSGQSSMGRALGIPLTGQAAAAIQAAQRAEGPENVNVYDMAKSLSGH